MRTIEPKRLKLFLFNLTCGMLGGWAACASIPPAKAEQMPLIITFLLFAVGVFGGCLIAWGLHTSYDWIFPETKDD